VQLSPNEVDVAQEEGSLLSIR